MHPLWGTDLDGGGGCHTGMVLLDLQKAFDTVNHDILLMKMKAMGLNNRAVNWFGSYLSGRTQCVSMNNLLSTHREIVCGVPQGSILGPLLFLMYVNDMERAVNCKLLLYADDSALLVSGRSVEEIESRLTRELESVRGWLTDNKLSLHLGKTESILFGSPKLIRKRSVMKISCGESSSTAKSTVGYLGLKLGQTLDGQEIYDRIITKANSRLKFLYRQAGTLSTQTKRTLVSALIQPHFDYACSSWYYGLNQKSKNRLQTCQNKLIHFVLGLDSRTHLGNSQFREVRWLPIERRMWQMGMHLVYKILNGHVPAYVSPGIQRTSDRHTYNTRSRAWGLVIPKVCSHGQKTFLYNSIKRWNGLPLAVQSLPTLGRFKTALRRHLWL